MAPGPRKSAVQKKAVGHGFMPCRSVKANQVAISNRPGSWISSILEPGGLPRRGRWDRLVRSCAFTCDETLDLAQAACTALAIAAEPLRFLSLEMRCGCALPEGSPEASRGTNLVVARTGPEPRGAAVVGPGARLGVLNGAPT
jgi:hypothetical protein